MKKRVLAALLALVMLFGALPMSVFAVNEDVNTYADDIKAENEDVEGSNGSTTVDPTKVIPAVLEEDSTNKPYVQFWCTTDGCKQSYYVELTSEMYTVTTHTATEYKIDWNMDGLLKAYNKKIQAEGYPEHEWTEINGWTITPYSVTWTWDTENQAWKYGNGYLSITANVKSTASSTVTPPDISEMTIWVGCRTGNEGKSVPLADVKGTEKEENGKYTISIDQQKLCEYWDRNYDSCGKHSVNEITRTEFVWSKNESNTWTLDDASRCRVELYSSTSSAKPSETAPEARRLPSIKFICQSGCDHDASYLHPNETSMFSAGTRTDTTLEIVWNMD